QARDVFAQMLVGGVLALFVTQAAVNLSMNLGLLPITGLPLPFMSYGGSSLISFSILFGIVLSVHRQLKQTGSHVSDRSSLYEIG
ncbi:MAG: FtsW/RodA/SpoVE family cell cycle protein, partial [Candidatus Paceibacteria bacterium]